MQLPLQSIHQPFIKATCTATLFLPRIRSSNSSLRLAFPFFLECWSGDADDDVDDKAGGVVQGKNEKCSVCCV
jgi:hypothetical protein